MDIQEKISLAKEVDIIDLLQKYGYTPYKKGSRVFFNSPFNPDDSTPSLMINNDNTCYDFSMSKIHDTISVVMNIEYVDFVTAVNSLLLNKHQYKGFVIKPIKKKEVKPFILSKYINTNKDECMLISEYAKKRRIYGNVVHSFFYEKDDNGDYIRHPALGFVHTDKNNVVCGIKLRKVLPYKGNKFSSRGSLMYYILEDDTYDVSKKSLCYNGSNALFIIEGEGNANSLFNTLKRYYYNFTVLSLGGNTVKKNIELPDKYKDSKKIYIIIDYDGNSEKYEQNIKPYIEKFNGEVINLFLDKGEDINSIFASDGARGVMERIRGIIDSWIQCNQDKEL